MSTDCTGSSKIKKKQKHFTTKFTFHKHSYMFQLTSPQPRPFFLLWKTKKREEKETVKK